MSRNDRPHCMQSCCYGQHATLACFLKDTAARHVPTPSTARRSDSDSVPASASIT